MAVNHNVRRTANRFKLRYSVFPRLNRSRSLSGYAHLSLRRLTLIFDPLRRAGRGKANASNRNSRPDKRQSGSSARPTWSPLDGRIYPDAREVIHSSERDVRSVRCPYLEIALPLFDTARRVPTFQMEIPTDQTEQCIRGALLAIFTTVFIVEMKDIIVFRREIDERRRVEEWPFNGEDLRR